MTGLVYADFAYYSDVFLGGVLAEGDFPRLAARASERVDMLTFYRAEAYVAAAADPEPVRKATCAVAEILYQLEQEGALVGGSARNNTVLTEIAGGYHVQYAAPTHTASLEGQAVINQAVIRAALPYLYPTGLLNMGVPYR